MLPGRTVHQNGMVDMLSCTHSNNYSNIHMHILLYILWMWCGEWSWHLTDKIFFVNKRSELQFVCVWIIQWTISAAHTCVIVNTLMQPCIITLLSNRVWTLIYKQINLIIIKEKGVNNWFNGDDRSITTIKIKLSNV